MFIGAVINARKKNLRSAAYFTKAVLGRTLFGHRIAPISGGSGAYYRPLGRPWQFEITLSGLVYSALSTIVFRSPKKCSRRFSAFQNVSARCTALRDAVAFASIARVRMRVHKKRPPEGSGGRCYRCGGMTRL
jgi:stalled ribosome alternative rescue factor ArfA